ncbi:hypothetical protein PoB_003064800 [Plakobranchus ocellatus]|uniref:Uncharacterized protein n=1 Tax=Plakobranchus ocellatus TaxID=259542 RepID=A0AAV4ABM1_9GAST|nr:hypothetical protein PoB_003064800 [Plakobranchus ocellatus]
MSEFIVTGAPVFTLTFLDQEADKGVVLQEDLSKTESSFKQKLSKAIPLAPGDCLECKLVGSGVMMLSGAIVLSSAFTASRQGGSTKIPVKGPRKLLYYAICGSLFLVFESAAICRLFDLGPFAKPANQSSPR